MFKDIVRYKNIQIFLITMSMSIMCMMINLDALMVFLAAVPISQYFHVSIEQIQWLVNSYLFTALILFILAGKLADIFSRKTIFLIGATFFTLASALAGVTANYWLLIAARILQGAGFGFTFVIVILITTSIFPVSKKGLALGIIMTVGGLSQAFGPTLAGVIIHYISWRWIFLINVPLGIISIVVAALFYKKDLPVAAQDSIDYFGSILLGGGLLALLFALNIFSYSWQFNYEFWLLIILFLVLIVGFVARELSIKSPLIQLRLLKIPNYSLILFIRTVYQYVWVGLLFILPIYLQNICNYTALKAGFVLSFMAISFALISLFAGRWIDRSGYKITTIFGLILAIIAVLVFAILNPVNSNLLFFVGLIVFGFSTGILVSSTPAVVIASVAKKHSGSSMGAFYTLAFVGATIAVAVTTILIMLKSKLFMLHSLTILSLHLSSDKLASLLKMANGSLALTDSSFLPIIKQSFMYAFSSVMWVNVILLIAALIASCYLRKIDIYGS